MAPNVAGVQCMKLFLSDLLGRDTTDAKIFNQAVEKELRTTEVVSIYIKILAVLVVIGLNTYFVFGAIMYGRDKSYKWQTIWLSTFIFNFAFETVVNGTLEVITLT